MVIGVTATDDEETFDEGFQIGIDDFMTKPFTMETFHSKFACFSNKFT
jgi:DNA-binding response OmpR family regulator